MHTQEKERDVRLLFVLRLRLFLFIFTERPSKFNVNVIKNIVILQVLILLNVLDRFAYTRTHMHAQMLYLHIYDWYIYRYAIAVL